MVTSIDFQNVFPLGSHLYRMPMPPIAELKRDMENLKRHGFNLIKIQEHWALDEPVEGRYDFSPHAELIEYAAKLDMGIYLGLTCEQAPAWLWMKHPGCRMIRRDGLPVAYEAQSTLPADGKPGPCFDHPGAEADQLRFIHRLVTELGRYENIAVWNTWQEVAYWSERFAGDYVCYCDNTIRAFQNWLQGKYGDLDALNRAWNTRYGSWQLVLPDRMGTGWSNLPQDIEWRYFMDDVHIERTLTHRLEAIRAADPLKRPVFAHLGSPVIGSGREWRYARTQDFLGSSCYPAWRPFHAWDDDYPRRGRVTNRTEALVAEAWGMIALRFDYVRSCNRRDVPIWAAEFQGGPVSTGFHKGRVPSAEDMRRWMLTAVGSGVTAISFWVTRAEIMPAETNGFSLLDSVGDSTPRYEEAARIGQALNAHAPLFGSSSWPGAEVGILIDEWNHQFCNTIMAGGGEHLGYSVRGWHRLLWEAGIPVDFVELSELDPSTEPGYKALILPFGLAISEVYAAALAQYVEAGGTLISEAAPGRFDEYGFSNRGELSPTLAALFGVRQESFTLVAEPDSESGPRWSPTERTWGEYLPAGRLDGRGPLDGHSLRANAYIQTFALDDNTESVLHYGPAVAGTKHQIGRGTAWLIGTFVGHNGMAYRDPETRQAVSSLLAQTGVKPLHVGSLLLRRRVADGQEAWIFTNPTETVMSERISVAGWGRVEDLLGEPLNRQGDSLDLAVGSLDVRVLIVSDKLS